MFHLAVTCGDPPQIEFGEVFSSNNKTVSGTIVEYSCISSKYHLIGAKQLVCLPSGQYNKPPPQCKGKSILKMWSFNLFLYVFLTFCSL